MKARLLTLVCMSTLISAPAALAEEPAPGKAQSTMTGKKSGHKKKHLKCKDCEKAKKDCDCHGKGHREGVPTR